MVTVYIKVFLSSAISGKEFSREFEKFHKVGEYDDSYYDVLKAICFDPKFPRDSCSFRVDGPFGSFLV